MFKADAAAIASGAVSIDNDGGIHIKKVGDYTFTACLSGSDADATVQQTFTVKAAYIVFEKALWAYTTGRKRWQTGYNENSYAYIDLKGISNLKATVSIWLQPQGTAIEEVIGNTEKTYLIAQQTVTFDAEGSAQLKTHTGDTYKDAIQRLFPRAEVIDAPLLFTLAFNASNSAVQLPSTTEIQYSDGTAFASVASPSGTQEYLVLSPTERLVLGTRQKVKSILFSNTQKTNIAIGSTTSGKTHAIWVHTTGMVDQALTIVVNKELSKDEAAASVTTNQDPTTATVTTQAVVAAVEKTYENQTVNADGFIEVDFTVPALEEATTYTATVFKKDAQGNLIQLDDGYQSAFMTTYINPDTYQIELQIDADLSGASDEAKAKLAKQLSTHVVLHALPEAVNSDNETQAVPVYVDVAEIKRGTRRRACPNCEKDITLEDLKAVCDIEDESGLQEAVDFLNEHRALFQLDTCTRKAHFLAQLAHESKFSVMEENFNYSAKSLKDTFSNFKTSSGKTKADLWGRADGVSTPVSDTNQIKIANYAYAQGNKANDLGNTKVTDSKWENAQADGWNYRGSGFLQITGKSNFKTTGEKYNSWIATDASGIAEEDFKANPDKLRTNKTLAMAAALIFWRENNLLTRSDAGAGEVALRSITLKINSEFAGYNDRKSKLEKAVDVLKVKDCPDYKRREGQNGTVVVVEGKGDHKIDGYVVYQTNVYRSMTLEQYKELKDADNLPYPDYITYLSRDAFDVSSTKIPIVKHSENRYGQYNECPPGEYYLTKIKRTYELYLGGSINETLIEGPDGDRDGVAIHHFSPKDTQGCLTFVSGNDTSPVFRLIDAIPDLFVHKQLKNKTYTDTDDVEHDMSIDQQVVRIILEEREVTESTWENTANGTTKWTGIVDKQKNENDE